ncbi:MAG: hypothetical protein IPI11_12315 [Haliscomenobacter sp.]|nr:hypothetical protein [Haliscomenobacter sp.]
MIRENYKIKVKVSGIDANNLYALSVNGEEKISRVEANKEYALTIPGLSSGSRVSVKLYEKSNPACGITQDKTLQCGCTLPTFQTEPYCENGECYIKVSAQISSGSYTVKDDRNNTKILSSTKKEVVLGPYPQNLSKVTLTFTDNNAPACKDSRSVNFPAYPTCTDGIRNGNETGGGLRRIAPLARFPGRSK